VALIIRQADLGADRALIVETLRRFLTPRSNTERYDWLYTENPHGPAAAWIGTEGPGGDAIGMASAFPRVASFEGRVVPCWVLGDFCIDQRYRTLGPALQLNRTCLAEVDRGAVSFCFDFPSRSMMAVYQRLGVPPFDRTIRFAKVLRWGPRLRRAPSRAAIGWPLGLLGEIADRVPRRRAAVPRGVTVALQEGPCDDAFDRLDETVRTRNRIHLHRSAAYLNWRYLANPVSRYEILAARDGASLRGYAVFTQTDSDAILADLVSIDDEATRYLLDELATLLRRRDVVTVSAPLTPSHPLVPAVQRSGYRPREEGPVIVHGATSPDPFPKLQAGDLWLTHGDRES
jgi:hypothetical protein